MSKRVQARRDNVNTPASSVNKELIQTMQQTIQELQLEVSKLKAKVTEEQVARRDQLLMENLRELRQRKQKSLWNRVVQFALQR